MENLFIEKYRQESYILEHNRNRSDMNPTVMEGNKGNLEGHLLRLKGNEDKVYFDSAYKPQPCTLTILREKQKELENRWEQYCTEQMNLGNRKPKVMPADMQEESDKLTARTIVANEEIQWLEKSLQETLEDQKKSKGSLLTHPKYWGSSSLRHGQLVEIGPWSVAPDSEGLLRISDESSPYTGLEVWRFKAEVLNPMSQEFILRQRKATAEALKLNRPKKAVHYPEPPTYDAKHDNIEYPGDYDPSIIRKLKQSVE